MLSRCHFHQPTNQKNWNQESSSNDVIHPGIVRPQTVPAVQFGLGLSIRSDSAIGAQRGPWAALRVSGPPKVTSALLGDPAALLRAFSSPSRPLPVVLPIRGQVRARPPRSDRFSFHNIQRGLLPTPLFRFCLFSQGPQGPLLVPNLLLALNTCNRLAVWYKKPGGRLAVWYKKPGGRLAVWYIPNPSIHGQTWKTPGSI